MIAPAILQSGITAATFARRVAVVLMTAVLVSSIAHPAERDGRWAILVAGISGDQELQAEYLNQLKELRGILLESLHFPKDQVTVLFDDPSKDPSSVQAESSWKQLEAVCREYAGRARREDVLFVFLLGHGSYDGIFYKMNLVGPDPPVRELAAALYAIPSQTYIIVNNTTAGGAAIAALSGKGKIIISATKSGNEKNRTHFGGYFIEALKDNNADVDKNGRVTLLEAFQYASKKVEAYYTKEGSLQTEHPVLEDNGDGQPHPDPGPENGDGFLARTTSLNPAESLLTRAGQDPERARLALEARELEKKIEALKYAKSDMPEADYEKQLEELLLKLAVVNAKLRNK